MPVSPLCSAYKGWISFWDFVTLIDIMLLGHWLDAFYHGSVKKCARIVGSIATFYRTCRKKRSYLDRIVDIKELHKDDIAIIRARGKNT